MPKKSFYLLLIFYFLLAPNALADVKVNISGNGEGSTSSVDVNSSYSSSTKTTNSNTTDIVIETNGVKKEYHGSDPNVSISSDDGNNTVTINGTSPKASAKVTIKNNINITTDSDPKESSPSSTPFPEASNSADKDQLNESEKGVIAMLEEFRKQIVDFFKFF